MLRFAPRNVIRSSGRWIDHSAELSRRQAKQRAREVRDKISFIAQCSIAAGATYLIAKHVFNVAVPLYAPVAAILTLGMSYGKRFSRAAEVTIGVAIGTLVGELFFMTVGMGAWQVCAIVAIAMVLASAFGASTLMINQAGIQGLIIAMLAGSTTPAGRWSEALIGASIGLLFAGIVPSSVFRRPNSHASLLLERLGSLLLSSVKTIRTADRNAAEDVLEEARAMEKDLTTLRGFAADSLEITTFLPWYRSRHEEMKTIADALEPMDRAVRNARVLVRRGTISVQMGEEIPEEYVQLMIELARISDDLALCFGKGGSRENVQSTMWDLSRRTARPVAEAPLSAEVMRAQVRSIIVDYYMILGTSLEDARRLVREADEKYAEEAQAAIGSILDDLEPETGALPACEFTYTGIIPVIPTTEPPNPKTPNTPPTSPHHPS
ncbi:hypothetical protein GZ172_00840 [Dermatophilus congolensis]|uniref:FUSC family protein n=1 Tax=Dermatophilus congolensis TaxID=1863 RepID=UPI001AAE76E1|nr:FUSC family protein [Dermatophilus congolensis]MBO3200626.1 hypothetical protein [Dermatophilus congolensis]MBO3216461.1 hypothetical protein [Dermatophilus congolensis]